MQSGAFRTRPGADGTVKYVDYNTPPPSYGDELNKMNHFPSAEILLGGYNGRINGVANGNQRDTRQRTSPPLDDPIATHLLVETALGDSLSFDILPYDELEDLKKQDQNLQGRVNTVRRQLALETKVRDAAKSLNRLYSRPGSSTSSSPRMRRSSSGNSISSKEVLEKAETQLATATKKVDELSRELYSLEQRLRQTQMKLLQHTAGILQLTHRGPKDPNDILFAPGGRPDSPASLDDESDYNRGFAEELDGLDGFLDELKSGKPRSQSTKRSSVNKEAFMTVARQVEDLNDRMQEMLNQVNPEKARQYTNYPRVGLDNRNVESTVTQQLEHLSRGLEDIRLEQGSQSRSAIDTEVAEMKQALEQQKVELQASFSDNYGLEQQKMALEDEVSGQLGNINNEIYELSTSVLPNQEVPAIPFNNGPTELLRYTQERITNLKTAVQSLSEAAESSRNASAQYEATLEGLWQYILAGEEENKKRKQSERQKLSARRAAGEDLNSDDDLSPDEDEELPAQFSLPAFSTKVQWLMNRSAYLREKQTSLRRKMREGAARDLPAVEEMRSETDRMQTELDNRERRIQDLESEVENAVAEARDDARLASAELSAKLDEVEEKKQGLEQQLADMQKEREERDILHKKTDNELRELEAQFVSTKTELSMTQAELESAYGSRSQRKAEAAAAANTEAMQRLEEANSRITALNSQIDRLEQEKLGAKENTEKEDTLKQELADTLKEFEELTRQQVEQEKERDELESQIDGFREKIEGLEGQLAEEKVKWLGMGSPGGGEKPKESTSAMVLKNEFKKMMRDTRTEHVKALRAEQEERRRLESMIRSLKKDGPGKSGLSYTRTA